MNKPIQKIFSIAIFLVLCVMLIPQLVQAKERVIKPPSEVSAGIERIFPGAAIVGAKREHEKGIMFYDVKLKKNKKIIFIEVAPNGSIGEIEDKVELRELPKTHAEKILTAVKGGQIISIERRKTRGVLEGKGFKPLKEQKSMYEVKYLLGRKKLSVDVSGDKTIIFNDKDIDADDENLSKDKDEYEDDTDSG